MKKLLGNLLKIQKEEMGLFLWTASLLFLIRISNILFNNYAETAFLKRFGVEYLPMVYMANAIVTFIIMGAMTGVMKRLPSWRLLANMLLVCGVTVAGLRFVVMAQLDIIYPVLFLLKSQYEALLALVFWNLANDVFNTRQSKRIFPLITAGGVLGAILGSFGTPWLSKLVLIDNLMLIYLGTTVLGAAVVWRMGSLFSGVMGTERKAKKVKKRTPLREELANVIPLIKESNLIKILVLITFLPNVLIPIMNYQFNFAVNQAFESEGALVAFFGYFRGALNVVSLVILLFVGKIYGRWGLPVALMFHPINYLFAFLALLLRFDVISAMYARISTNVLRVTINNPARDVLMGLFPVEFRALVRPFLRGTVVRVGILLGSGAIMLYEGLGIEARFLGVVGTICSVAWIISCIFLKRTYSSILLDLISKNILDLKSLEAKEAGQVFRDEKAKQRLVEACLAASGEACVWYAEMLKEQKVEDLDKHLVALIRRQDDEDVVIRLLPLFSTDAGPEVVEALEELAGPGKPRLNTALAKTAARLPREVSGRFLATLLARGDQLSVHAQAVAGLYRHQPDQYRGLIEGWLASRDPAERLAGAQAAGGSGEKAFIPALQELLKSETDPEVAAGCLVSLSRLDDPQAQEMILSRLERGVSVPEAVLNEFTVQDDRGMSAFITLLGDPSPKLRNLAREKLKESDYNNTKLLLEALAQPNRKLKAGVFQIMETLQITDLEMVAFAKGHLERAYHNLVEINGVKQLPESPERLLLADHLAEIRQGHLDTILRVLATQDASGQMRIIARGIASVDDRLRSNAIEALETMLGSSLSAAMLPMVEESTPEQALAAGRRQFKLPDYSEKQTELLRVLLAKRSPVTLYLVLAIVQKGPGPAGLEEALEPLTAHPDRRVNAISRALLGKEEQMEAQSETQAPTISLSEKIVLFRGMELFKGLAVAELAAIASITEEQYFQGGETIIKEGEPGETMYLIVSGTVTVHKSGGGGCDIELDGMGAGAYFGEMALFDDQVRSATVIAQSQAHLLVLHKQEFSETVREYPQVALQICRELSSRVRHLQQRIQSFQVC